MEWRRVGLERYFEIDSVGFDDNWMRNIRKRKEFKITPMYLYIWFP